MTDYRRNYIEGVNMENQLIPHITGLGLKSFEDNLGYFEQNFDENLKKLKKFDEPVDFISTKASAYIQEDSFKKVYNKQMSESSWFERNIFMSSDKEKNYSMNELKNLSEIL